MNGVEPSDALQEPETYDYRAFVRDLKKVLKELAGQTEKQVKLVMLIDEVDELNHYDPRVNQKLRSLFMRSFAENLVAVVSGVSIKKHWENEGSPWYNFFEEIKVEAFQRADAERLILDPMQGMFKVDAGVVDRIVEITECKPFRIQGVCRDLVKRGHERHNRNITVADVDAVIQPEGV